ncbi:hypothetical protein AB0J83_40750 [Actinoplanes sp. NPDC049596]|uniref:hypothetical protein n=1 Tax=unclassified Actinoplanes TaxID=2626549 RepID=UPI0034359F21
MGGRAVAAVALFLLLPLAPAHDPFCGGEVTNHSPWYVRISHAPASVWLRPYEFSAQFPAFRDTDAFEAPPNCVTTVVKHLGPLRLGSWSYDRLGRDSLWIPVPNTQVVDVTAMRC